MCRLCRPIKELGSMARAIPTHWRAPMMQAPPHPLTRLVGLFTYQTLIFSQYVRDMQLKVSVNQYVTIQLRPKTQNEHTIRVLTSYLLIMMIVNNNICIKKTQVQNTLATLVSSWSTVRASYRTEFCTQFGVTIIHPLNSTGQTPQDYNLSLIITDSQITI